MYLFFILDALTVTAKFNMNGVNGNIAFTQQSPIVNRTVITVSLSGLDQYPSEQFPWHIHKYPFKAQSNPCYAASGHYDPLMTGNNENYSALCSNDPSLCEVGDLNRKLGPLYPNSTAFVDMYLPLYGAYSIVGRSVVISRKHRGRWVCANIEYGSDVTVAYSPFRHVLVGNIYFIEPYVPINFTNVFTSLSYQNGSVNSTGHNWHVHKNAIGESGDCIDAGPHYNPRNIPTNEPTYQTYCSPSNQMGCEVGDLSGKSSQLNFNNGNTFLFYSDTELPLSKNKLDETIVGRSVVVHAQDSGNLRIACSNIIEFNSRTAVARFQEDGVSGQITFHQVSPFSPTTVTVELSGLSSRASGYHVHDFPVDETVPGTGKCANSFAGGHFNPRNVVQDSSSPMTFDGYEIGDLSGKYGSLAGQDSISVNYSDPYLPLFGVDSIVGRSIVIHYPNGSRWLCANIQYDMDTVSVTLEITSGTLQGRLVLTQLANDPFSETKIFLDVDYTGPPVTVISSPSMSSQVSTSAMSSTSKSSSMTVTSSSAMQSSNASLSPSLMPTTTTVMPPSSTSSMFVSMSKLVSSMLPPSSSSVKEFMSTSTVVPSVTTSTIKSTSTFKMNPFTMAVMSSSIMSTSSMQLQTTSTSLSISSSTIMASSTVLVPTTTTMVVTSSTPVVVTTSSSMMTTVTSSTNSDDKLTTSEDKAESTTSITKAPTTSSSSSSEMLMSSDPGPMNTMDMDMSSTPTPTNSARKRGDVFKRQVPVSGSFIHLSIQTGCGAGAPVVNPYGASLTCSPDNQLACPVGDLTGKHGVLSERSLLTDLNLPLTGPNASELLI